MNAEDLKNIYDTPTGRATLAFFITLILIFIIPPIITLVIEYL